MAGREILLAVSRNNSRLTQARTMLSYPYIHMFISRRTFFAPACNILPLEKPVLIETRAGLGGDGMTKSFGCMKISKEAILKHHWIPLIFLILVLVNTSSVPLQAQSKTIYNILKDQKTSGIKRSVAVRLNNRVSKEALITIAQEIKAKDHNRYERVFILYYLPGMEVGAGAWASSHFNPNLKIEIMGATDEDVSMFKKSSSTDSNRKIIGTWLEEHAPTRKLVLYRAKGKVFLETVYKSGNAGSQEMGEKKTSVGFRFFKNKGSSQGDYFLLNKNGDLEIWDSEGLISTAKKLIAK